MTTTNKASKSTTFRRADGARVTFTKIGQNRYEMTNNAGERGQMSGDDVRTRTALLTKFGWKMDTA